MGADARLCPQTYRDQKTYIGNICLIFKVVNEILLEVSFSIIAVVGISSSDNSLEAYKIKARKYYIHRHYSELWG